MVAGHRRSVRRHRWAAVEPDQPRYDRADAEDSRPTQGSPARRARPCHPRAARQPQAAQRLTRSAHRDVPTPSSADRPPMPVRDLPLQRHSAVRHIRRPEDNNALTCRPARSRPRRASADYSGPDGGGEAVAEDFWLVGHRVGLAAGDASSAPGCGGGMSIATTSIGPSTDTAARIPCSYTGGVRMTGTPSPAGFAYWLRRPGMRMSPRHPRLPQGGTSGGAGGDRLLQGCWAPWASTYTL